LRAVAERENCQPFYTPPQ